jgi:hypothetical protein
LFPSSPTKILARLGARLHDQIINDEATAVPRPVTRESRIFTAFRALGGGRKRDDEVWK